MPVAGHKSRILVGDFHLAAYANDITASWEADMLDATVFTTAPAKSFVAGKDTGTFTIGGLYDVEEHTDLAGWKSATAQPITYAPNAYSLSSAVWMGNALLTEVTTSSSVSGLAEFTVGAQVDGIVDLGVSLHDLSAETTDGDGTSHDFSAASSNGAAAHLHVTAFSGLDDIEVTIADSANNTDFATIGTFTTATGVTGERITIAGAVRRYVRASWDVTGTGSATFQVGFARR